MTYMFVTQNETPYRITLCKKPVKDIILEICWTYNLYNCKKLTSKRKCCESYILISAQYSQNKTAIQNIEKLPVKQITIWKKLTGHLIIQHEIKKNQSSIELDFVLEKGQLMWIKTWIKQQKCSSCGRIYAKTHTCDYNRSSYYYNQIDCTKKYWETISFQPIGENPNTKKLFLIYDIETYSLTESQGTILIPVLLCFTIFGDQDLITLAEREIKKDTSIKVQNNCYYWINTERNFISNKFKILRDNILHSMILMFLDHILTKENNEILNDFKTQRNLENITDINILTEKDLLLSLKVEPCFLEFYVVGHNITSFDEILLATQILQEERYNYSPFLTVTRNFMPRQGKILFNDITIQFPYPEHFVEQEERPNVTAEIMEDLKSGTPSLHLIKNIYVKSMVRDTFQLTHTSLKNAATAYNLSVSKGCCPFKAVNDFFSLNTYQADEHNFPAEIYWTDTNEYHEQKQLWLEKNHTEYNIVQELIDYCIKDVIVTKELTETLLETFKSFIVDEFKLNCNFNIFKRPTISSNSHAIFRQVHFSKQGTKPSKLPDIVAPSDEMYNFVRQSVRGGRCYPTYFGLFSEKLYVYDICGMYASALTHPMPYGIPVGEKERLEEIKKFTNLLSRRDKISYFNQGIKPMIVTVNAFPPPTELLDPLPPLCSKKSGKLCWTNEPLNNEVVTSIDIITLHNRGWQVQILPNKLNTVFPEWNTCCAEYVKVNILAKEKATKENNQVKRAISKLLSNALYGSFATKEDNEINIFESVLECDSKIKERLNKQELKIVNINSIPTEQLPSTNFTNIPFLAKQKEKPTERMLETDEELLSPFNPIECLDETTQDISNISYRHMTTYKPFNVLNVTSSNLTIYTLKSTNTFPLNKRYPTQLASFVLAWTRTFISEWAEILYGDEYTIPIQRKAIKAIYGDTDSLFLTESGHRRMLTEGKHRLKSPNSNLVFNSENPSITWCVECETVCHDCNSPAYSLNSIFLAPKLYGLKDITCTVCMKRGSGKIRAKGHSTSAITFEILTECFNYHKSCSNPEKKFSTERTALKRTLCKSYGKFSPFTIHQVQLIRELRPWNDPTLYFLTENVLIPYDSAHPNHRSVPPVLIKEFNDE
ncbi:DNA polymerase [Raptor adenovirus 1]|uniref:DNA polymerase n=1 Tax=Raptor adenovirus 1 TaxID=1520002 RepID=F4MI03_9ADEN|nr:DNA polymerase [Raptor adenovirus 1]AEC32098.1 DNA polymerase [Raptor adenovirus 1]